MKIIIILVFITLVITLLLKNLIEGSFDHLLFAYVENLFKIPVIIL